MGCVQFVTAKLNIMFIEGYLMKRLWEIEMLLFRNRRKYRGDVEVWLKLAFYYFQPFHIEI